MNTNKQILTTMFAVIIIAATTIFTGCNKYKAEVTGVTVCPIAEMVRVGNNTFFTELLTYSPETGAPDFSVTWTSGKPSVATVNSRTGIVNTHAVGESVITCVTKDGGFSASATVIVNPIEIDDDYATIVPSFYFGNTKINDETIDIGKLVTVKYHSRNKIVYSIDETFKLPRTGGYMELSLKADIPTDITKMEGYNRFNAVCEANLTIGKTSAPTILHLDGTFTPGGELNLIITFKNLPNMEDVTLNFKARGTYKIDC
ncbi:MAG: Ig-like domain-containing protein [Bacteroidetes bacterium]|nr:Ig-like domain-containing protein [Bacteroidota bacterium]MCL2302824.1 Ig-like domain-containing protein [Lentimicrobiaceae bacterium]